MPTLPIGARHLALLAALACAGSGPRRADAAAAPAAMTAAAKAFLAGLGPGESAKAAIAFSADERLDWHYTAKLRNGLPLKQMAPAQREAAMALLRAALSQKGFEKAETIRRLEDVLRALEGNPGRDREMYHFSVFGEPSESGVWGWRYEGHHVSLNFTVVDGTVVSTTPQFFGANPAEVLDGPMKGTRALAGEEDLARRLARSLEGEARRMAISGDLAPPEILTGAARDASRQEDAGVPYGRLDETQKSLLDALIEVHVEAHRPEQARRRRDRVRAGGLENVKFVWMGGLERGQGHYYRVQGPAFLIEYDNTQNGANHVHSVWREFDGDWGRDVLGDHYRTAPHHAGHRLPGTPRASR